VKIFRGFSAQDVTFSVGLLFFLSWIIFERKSSPDTMEYLMVFAFLIVAELTAVTSWQQEWQPNYVSRTP
ncbi:hypothetical protein Bpfe_022835, partial [Biomphalaria pfeifferi]